MNYAMVFLCQKKFPPLLGKSMLEYSIEALEELSIKEILCISNDNDVSFHENVLKRTLFLNQRNNLLACLKNSIKSEGFTIILFDNTPIVNSDLLKKLIERHEQEHNDITLCTMMTKSPNGYRTVIRNIEQRVTKLSIFKEERNYEKEDIEVFCDILCIENKIIRKEGLGISLDSIFEGDLNTLFEVFKKEEKVGSYCLSETKLFGKIKNAKDFASFEKKYRMKLIENHLENGVFIENQDTVFLGPDVCIEPGAFIREGSIVLGKTYIGKNCVIGPYSDLYNAILFENVFCEHSVIRDSTVKKNTRIGPYSHLRMNTIVGEAVRIGNFVEIKNSILGNRTKLSHLSYVGDTNCGDDVNFGCGSITVNYDGIKKNQTIIGNHVFVGCNSNLIAPIIIGNDAYIAAGSTITKNINENDFAIARTPQITKEGYAKKYKRKGE